ncbi:hypothetical protein BaRGS_00036298 [Batillaria attramentaria]|uniref:Uncharacterized protein n=1 Tax=Batillaria attramentaria TaxID=370345 RepID=A0ABD0JCU7_9CAEN
MEGIPSTSTSQEAEFLNSGDICFICGKDFNTSTDKVHLTYRGIKGINSVSRLGDDIHVSDGDCVHEDCWRTYTNKKVVDSKLKAQEAEKSPKKQPHLRKWSLPGAINDNQPTRLFCGVGKRHIRSGKQNPGKLIEVETMLFHKSVTKHCQQRGDKWAHEVSAKTDYMYLQDLRAADVVYHRICYTSFRKTGGQKPRMFQAEEETPK